MEQEPIFNSYEFGRREKDQLDHDGHFVFPGLLTSPACERLIESLSRVAAVPVTETHRPIWYAAEHDDYLAGLIAHPQMLALARSILGDEIRYDHCVGLVRQGGDPGQGWHSHRYAEDQPELGFIRIFFYVNGFGKGDGALKVVPGSHRWRDATLRAAGDEELQATWLQGKTHPLTGEPLRIEELEVPPATVIVMWTHAAHAVSPRREDSDTRWTVVFAYRNPGAPSRARWIREEFERHPPTGAEGLMALY